MKIASPEEIAFRQNFISPSELKHIIDTQHASNNYGEYLRGVLAGD